MQNRKEEILRCSAKLFRKRGYKATSMRDIAEVVGIKAASIYNHFSSKQEILKELLMLPAKLFTKGMKEVKNSPSSSLEKMQKIIDLHVHLAVEYTDENALITGDWVHLEEKDKQAFLALRDSYEADFRQIILDGKKEGVFKNVDTDIALFSILSTLRWLYSWYNKNKNYDIDKLRTEIKICLLAGLFK